MRCGKHRINTNGQIRLMFRLGGLRVSGKAVWVNAWWYGAYRCTVLVVTCCSAVVKVNSDREPYLSRSSSTVHTERSKLQGWGPDRSSEPQTPDPTRPDPLAPERSPATNTSVKVQLGTTERWNTDAIHDYYYSESGVREDFLLLF